MERMPTARERLDNFEANKIKQQNEKFEEAIYGKTAGVIDFSDEARQRLEEGMAYEEHLRKMSERQAPRALDMLDQEQAAADYQVQQEREAEEQRLAEQKRLEEEQLAEQKHLERLADDRVVHLMNHAKRISKLRASQE